MVTACGEMVILAQRIEGQFAREVSEARWRTGCWST